MKGVNLQGLLQRIDDLEASPKSKVSYDILLKLKEVNHCNKSLRDNYTELIAAIEKIENTKEK